MSLAYAVEEESLRAALRDGWLGIGWPKRTAVNAVSGGRNSY